MSLMKRNSMVNNKLDKLVDNICAIHSENDTKSFYCKVHKCCSECLLLINPSYLEVDEIEIIKQTQTLWDEDRNDSDIIRKLHFEIVDKWLATSKTNRERRNALEAIYGVLLSYETGWVGNECYRPDTLEFSVEHLENANVDKEQIYKIITKYFSVLP